MPFMKETNNNNNNKKNSIKRQTFLQRRYIAGQRAQKNMLSNNDY